jgi:hypothetical protein
MERYTMDSGGSTGNPQVSQLPAWVIFRAGECETRMPFDTGPADCNIWAYVLDITSIGFRADRVGDAIVITGRPSGMEVSLS